MDDSKPVDTLPIDLNCLDYVKYRFLTECDQSMGADGVPYPPSGSFHAGDIISYYAREMPSMVMKTMKRKDYRNSRPGIWRKLRFMIWVRPVTVSREEVEKISSLSPAHRLTVQSFLNTGRWMIKNKNGGSPSGEVKENE